MKEKIKYFLFLLFLFTLVSTANGQNGFISSNHSYEIDGNNLQLYLQAEFAIDYGICDFLDACNVNISNDTIIANVTYNIEGYYPQAGCIDYDTINCNIPDGNYKLLINTYVICLDEDSNIDTLQVSSQLFLNIILSINCESLKPFIKVFPNPAMDILQIEVSDDTEIEGIELFNMKGESVKCFSTVEKSLDVSELVSGVYFVRISTNKGEITKKVLIE